MDIDSDKDLLLNKQIISSIGPNYLLQQNRQNPSQIKFESVGKYPLLQPILFDIIYDSENDLYSLSNKELALYGYGKNYVDTIQSLEEEIEGHVVSFTRFSDERHTRDSLVIRDKLRQFIDFDTVMNTIQ